LTPEEAAELLGIGRSKVYELMASGVLRSIKVGRCGESRGRQSRISWNHCRLAPREPHKSTAIQGGPQAHKRRNLRSSCGQATKGTTTKIGDHALDCTSSVVLAQLRINPRYALPAPASRGIETTTMDRRRRITQMLRDEVVTRYEAGETSRELARECRIGRTTVLTILKQAGVKLRPQGQRRN